MTTLRRYDSSEIALLFEHYPNIAALRALLPDRPLGSIKYKALQLGLTKKVAPAWASDEDDCLRDCHPDFQLAHSRLPHRTLAAIKWRCGRLGLSKPYRKWSPAAKALLVRMTNVIPDKEIAAILGVTVGAVQAHRFLLPRSPGKSEAKPEVGPLVADIHLHAGKRGIRLDDVTKALGLPNLIRSRYPQQISMKVATQVALHLGGDLYVDWDDN